jgi:hypothetical protein
MQKSVLIGVNLCLKINKVVRFNAPYFFKIFAFLRFLVVQNLIEDCRAILRIARNDTFICVYSCSFVVK